MGSIDAEIYPFGLYKWEEHKCSLISRLTASCLFPLMALESLWKVLPTIPYLTFIFTV
jgi:hypothetical protein